jgi:hypothetical protein
MGAVKGTGNIFNCKIQLLFGMRCSDKDTKIKFKTKSFLFRDKQLGSAESNSRLRLVHGMK